MKAFAFLLVIFGGISVASKTGGWKRRSPEDEDIQKIANFAAFETTKQSNSLYVEKLLKVTDAWSQVVAGINYKIVFEIAPTECKKNSSKQCSANCDFQKCVAHQICKATIWARPWLNETEMTKLQCASHESSC